MVVTEPLQFQYRIAMLTGKFEIRVGDVVSGVVKGCKVPGDVGWKCGVPHDGDWMGRYGWLEVAVCCKSVKIFFLAVVDVGVGKPYAARTKPPKASCAPRMLGVTGKSLYRQVGWKQDHSAKSAMVLWKL